VHLRMSTATRIGQDRPGRVDQPLGSAKAGGAQRIVAPEGLALVRADDTFAIVPNSSGDQRFQPVRVRAGPCARPSAVQLQPEVRPEEHSISTMWDARCSQADNDVPPQLGERRNGSRPQLLKSDVAVGAAFSEGVLVFFGAEEPEVPAVFEPEADRFFSLLAAEIAAGFF
jgi:hypothetical protein